MRLTFRTKLLLAMMFVVTAVSVATLLVAERRVQQTYERTFRNQFERQIGYFSALQESRLSAVKEECFKLSESVRLIAALSEPELESAAFRTNLYQIAGIELRSALPDAGGAMPDPDAGGGLPAEGGGPRKAPPRERGGSFWILDADGKLIPPPPNARTRPRFVIAAMRQRLQTHADYVHEALAGTNQQQVGYFALPFDTNRFNLVRKGLRRMERPPGNRRAGQDSPESAKGKSFPKQGPPPDRMDEDVSPVLSEVIITKVVDKVTTKTVGALALVFPLPELVPQRKAAEKAAGATNDLELIQTGVLLADKFYADPSVIPESVGAVVGQQVSERIKATSQKQADFDCVVDGAHYRVFYELMSDSPAFPPAYQVCLYSTEEALREQRDLRWKVLSLGGGALMVALVLSLGISHGLSAPIRELVGGTNEIQKGNLQVRLPVRSTDEVGQLTASFNDMAEGLQERERYRTVLNMVQDERVARRLVAGEITLGGELRDVTVLFCDIRGFTALTQNMPPSEVIEMLNEHMTALVRVVNQHNGLLDKFVGDLLMAVFGAPEHHGDDTLNATRCALQLLRVREELNQTSRHQLRIGIGLATGTVVAGCMGSVDHLSYTVLGERVNLASRLCSRAGAGEILIDGNTRKKLGDNFQVEAIGETELRGFATPVPVSRLVGMKS